MNKIFLISGALCCAISVGAGAFGAHALAAKLEPRMLEIWETAARYQMYHGLGLIAVAWLSSQNTSTAISVSGFSFLAGIALFSGSLYILALSGIKWLGAITPLGGVAFIIGWIAMVVVAAKL